MFYMTYARARPDDIVPYAEKNGIGLMTNSAHRWSENTDRFLDMYEYNTPRIVDSGGYNVLRKWVSSRKKIIGELTKEKTLEVVKENKNELQEERDKTSPFFHWEVEDYHNWLSKHKAQFKWAAVMDYACEEKFDPLLSKEERIEKTLEHTIQHYNLNPDYKVLPVLQGRTFEDYMYSYNKLREFGIPTKHVGLGTVCRLSSTDKIVELEQKIRENTNVETIHGFGVKVESFKRGATFDTADSQAWVYPASNGKYYEFVDKDEPKLVSHPMPNDSRKRTVKCFKEYYKFVSSLMNSEQEHCHNCNSKVRYTKLSKVVTSSLDKPTCGNCAENLIARLA